MDRVKRLPTLAYIELEYIRIYKLLVSYEL